MTEPKPHYLPKENRWKLRYLYYEDGVRKERVFSSSKKGEAGKREVIVKYRAWRGNSFEFVWDKYIDSKKARLGNDSRAVKNEESIGNIYLLPKFSGQAIDSYKIQDYQDFINRLRLQNGDLPSKKYLSSVIATINSFINWAWETEYLYEQPRGKIYLPKDRNVKGKNIPTLEEFKRICQPTGLWHQPLIIFLCCTGLRPSEAIGIKAEDIIGDAVYIKRGILSDKSISNGKTKNAQRVVPLCDLAKEQIRIMRERCPNAEYIFCNSEGNITGQGRVYKQLQLICHKCGVREFSLYSCRHFFITYTADILGMSALRHTVGHSANMDSIGVYAHSTTEEQHQIKNSLNKIFNSK